MIPVVSGAHHTTTAAAAATAATTASAASAAADFTRLRTTSAHGIILLSLLGLGTSLAVAKWAVPVEWVRPHQIGLPHYYKKSTSQKKREKRKKARFVPKGTLSRRCSKKRKRGVSYEKKTKRKSNMLNRGKKVPAVHIDRQEKSKKRHFTLKQLVLGGSLQEKSETERQTRSPKEKTKTERRTRRRGGEEESVYDDTDNDSDTATEDSFYRETKRLKDAKRMDELRNHLNPGGLALQSFGGDYLTKEQQDQYRRKR